VSQAEQGHNGEEPRVVVRDRRRIDPATGAVRKPDPSSGPKHAASGPADANSGKSAMSAKDTTDTVGPTTDEADGEVGKLRSQLDERTSDLQRITAEYANYRRRVEREVGGAAAGHQLQRQVPGRGLHTDGLPAGKAVSGPVSTSQLGQFAFIGSPVHLTPDSACPFCEGHEDRTPPETLALGVGQPRFEHSTAS